MTADNRGMQGWLTTQDVCETYGHCPEFWRKKAKDGVVVAQMGTTRTGVTLFYEPASVIGLLADRTDNGFCKVCCHVVHDMQKHLATYNHKRLQRKGERANGKSKG